MLIQFKSKQSANFVMFFDMASQLLRMMGQGDRIEGSLSGDELKAALQLLEERLAGRGDTPTPASGHPTEDESQDNEPPVRLGARAAPLLEMMRKAVAADGYIMWEVD